MKRVLMMVFLALGASATGAQESGYQIINGTRVFTQIDHGSSTATFSNDCGQQTLTQSELQAGAIPTDIIPCPRPQTRRRTARCDEGYYLTKNNKCAPMGSIECGEVSCRFGTICNKDGREGDKCISQRDPRVCSNGSYCPGEHDICFLGKAGASCIAASSDRLCDWGQEQNSSFCPSGRVCVHLPKSPTDSYATEDKCVNTANRYSHRSGTGVCALVVSQSGAFFGLGFAKDGNTSAAENEASSLCYTQKTSTASTEDERREFCSRKASGECVAYAKGRSMVYKSKPYKEEEATVGVADGETEEEATAKAMSECKSQGGDDCFVVPESVKCINRINGQDEIEALPPKGILD